MKKRQKPLAFLLFLTIIVSAVLPTAAITSTTQADTLKAAGLFAGTTTGYNLTGLLTRDQGIALALRAQGMEPAVLRQTAAEVNTVMAKVTDASSIPGWARPYVAFALKQTPAITNGVSAIGDKVVFAPGQRMSSTQFISFLARAMGYPTTLDTALDAAVSAKMLTAGQIVKYSNIPAMNREQAVDVLYSAIRTGVLSGTQQLVIDKLVSQGIVSTSAAIALGYTSPTPIATPTPVATPTPSPEYGRLSVLEIQVPNTKQIKVVFNREVQLDTVLSANFIVKEAGTSIRPILAALQSDKRTVMLTLDGNATMANFTTMDITIKKAMKDLLGSTMDSDYVKTGVSVQDTKVPELQNIEILGKRTIRLAFDEPVWNGSSEVLSPSNFTVKGGAFSYVVMSATSKYQDRSILLTLGTDILPGNLSVTVNAAGGQAGHIRDFINFMTPTREVAVSYPTAIAEATAMIDSLNKTTRVVTIRFNKPVFGMNARLFMLVKGVDAYGSNLVSKPETLASDVWSFTMPATIPNGSVNFYLANSTATGSQLKDLFGIAVTDKEMVYVNVADTSAPSVLSITNAGNTAFDIMFNEELDVTASQKIVNYEVRNSTGSILPVTSAVLMPDLQTVRVYVALADLQTYTIKVGSIKDVSGNVLSSWTTTKTVSDTSNPRVTNVYAVPSTKKIYIAFSEAMNLTELSQKNNYLVDRDGGTGNYVGMGDGDTVIAVDGQHIILSMSSAITTPSVKMASMHDLSGKKLGSDLSFEYTGESGSLTNIGPETVSLEKVELVDRNMVQLTFNTEIGTLVPSDILFRQKVDGNQFTYPIQIQQILAIGVNASGMSEFTVQLDRTLNSDASYNDNTSGELVEVQVVASGGTESKSNAKIIPKAHPIALALLDAVGGAIALDGMSTPVITWSDFNSDGKLDTVVVKYDEAVKETSLSTMSFSVAGYTINAVSVDYDGIVSTGNQGDHAASSRYVVLNISKSGQINDAGTKPTVTQVYPVTDLAGNVIE